MGEAAIKDLARERQKELRTMARGIAGSSRMDKTRLVEALAAQRSPYSDFSPHVRLLELQHKELGNKPGTRQGCLRYPFVEQFLLVDA